jgi:hypothetical protein
MFLSALLLLSSASYFANAQDQNMFAGDSCNLNIPNFNAAANPADFAVGN